MRKTNRVREKDRTRKKESAREGWRDSKYLYEVVDSLQVCQVVISHIHADTEVQASIASIDDLKVPKL